VSAKSVDDPARVVEGLAGTESATPVLALDFGTSNTYVAKCPGDREDPVGLDFGDGRDGIATAILYREGKEPLIGNLALEEFGDGAADHPDYRLRAQFKPDLAKSAEARANARDFLAALLELGRRQNKDIAPTGRQSIFGVPSEAGEEYREALRALAREAGFGEIRTVDEPKGALYFHIHRKDVSTAEALQGVLTIDFGGGTCDFALVVRGEVLHSWGDMHLGGRLFDDLFFQWLIEQNPEVEETMARDRAEFFVLAVRAREAKEKFSLAMALDRSQVFRKSMGEYGRLSGVTWEGFLERARRYRPSPTFAQYLQAMNPWAYAQLSAADQGLDLVDWFRRTLRQGLTDEQVRGRELGCAILTGGSSAWPFVADIVREELARLGQTPRLVQSDRPYITVSQGLAIVPALQRRLAVTQTALCSELPEFVETRIVPLIERRLAESAEGIGEAVAAGLFDRRIEPVLRAFRETGGSVAALKEQIAAQAEAFGSELETIVREQVGRILAGLANATTELMESWYRQHKLTVGHGLDRTDPRVDLAGGLRIAAPDIYGEIQNIVWTLSTGIVTVIGAVVSGGAGTALIAHGPIGLAIGAVIGLVAGALTLYYGVEEAKRRAEEWDGAPVWLIARALTDDKIASLREDIKEQVAEKVKAQAQSASQALEEQIRLRVEGEIANLSAISQFF
jgi:molecular chaperone DnaK